MTIETPTGGEAPNAAATPAKIVRLPGQAKKPRTRRKTKSKHSGLEIVPRKKTGKVASQKAWAKIRFKAPQA